MTATTGLATAQREADDAVQLLAALEERVRDGDTGVRPSELRDARELIEFSSLRVAAATRRAAQIDTEVRRGLYATLAADAAAVPVSTDPPIVEAFTDALAALRTLYALAETRSARVIDIHHRAVPIVEAATDHDEQEALRAAGVWCAGTITGVGHGVTLTPVAGESRSVVDVPAWQLAAAVLGRILDDQAATDPGGAAAWSAVLPPLRHATQATAREFPELAAGDRED